MPLLPLALTRNTCCSDWGGRRGRHHRSHGICSPVLVSPISFCARDVFSCPRCQRALRSAARVRTSGVVFPRLTPRGREGNKSSSPYPEADPRATTGTTNGPPFLRQTRHASSSLSGKRVANPPLIVPHRARARGGHRCLPPITAAVPCMPMTRTGRSAGQVNTPHVSFAHAVSCCGRGPGTILPLVPLLLAPPRSPPRDTGSGFLALCASFPLHPLSLTDPAPSTIRSIAPTARGCRPVWCLRRRDKRLPYTPPETIRVH